MAAFQQRVPGAEYRAKRCPSSVPLWKKPAHALYLCTSIIHCSRTAFSPQGTQLLQGPCPQLLPASITVENNHVPNRRRRLCQLNGMNCMPQITHTCSALSATSSLFLSPTRFVSICWLEPCSFMAYVCRDSVKGTGRKGQTSSDAPTAVDQRR